MDSIIIKGMQFYGYHGALAQEQQLGQKFIVDVVLSLDLKPAGQTDRLDHTVNYAAVYHSVKQIVEGKPFKLIEALAETIAENILQNFDIQAVNVQVRKPQAPIPGMFDYVAVNITRHRQPLEERHK